MIVHTTVSLGGGHYAEDEAQSEAVALNAPCVNSDGRGSLNGAAAVQRKTVRKKPETRRNVNALGTNAGRWVVYKWPAVNGRPSGSAAPERAGSYPPESHHTL
jgi:hypothetical protein